jgi:hypothetical protein
VVHFANRGEVVVVEVTRTCKTGVSCMNPLRLKFSGVRGVCNSISRGAGNLEDVWLFGGERNFHLSSEDRPRESLGTSLDL